MMYSHLLTPTQLAEESNTLTVLPIRTKKVLIINNFSFRPHVEQVKVVIRNQLREVNSFIIYFYIF